MKLIYAIILVAAFHIPVPGQENKIRVADQFLLSATSSLSSLRNSKFTPGFGAGVYRTFLPGKIINGNLGIEYNKTFEFHKYVLIGHFGHYDNLTYNKSCVSIPLNSRFSPGKDSRWFFELGGYYDWVISSRQQGIAHTYVPDSNWQPQEMYVEVDESAGLGNSFGAALGCGLRFPGHHYDGIIKLDVKQTFVDTDFDKNQVLSRIIRIHAGIALN